MVRYRCSSCKVRLESPDELVGKPDTCPDCGHTCTVPQAHIPRRRLRVAAIVGGVLAVIVVATVVVFHGRSNTNGHTQAKDAAGTARQRTAAAANLKDLTVADVSAYAKRRNMKAVAGSALNNGSVEPEDWGAWENRSELYVRYVGFPGPDKRIKTLFISRTSEKHGPAGQAMVLAAWNDICPSLTERFRNLFKTTRPMTSRLHWIDDTPYAYGVSENNKAFVEYVGPQSDMQTRRQYAIIAAGTKVNWFKTIMASQQRLQAALKGSLSTKESLEIVIKEMSQFSVFKDMDAMEVWRTETLVRRYSVPQNIVLDAKSHINPESIPAQLPEETRLKLLKIATEIAAVARLTRFLVQRGDNLSFNPYEHMIMAFGEHPGVVRSVWGRYARIEGVDKWQLPEPLNKANKEITSAALASVMSVTKSKAPR